MKKLLKFIIYIFSPLLLGTLISLLIGFGSYKIINKPPLSPPAISFPIIWSILYLLMGISFYIINKNKLTSYKWYVIQLIINITWPILFFKYQLFVISTIWIILLEYSVVNMIVDFYKIKKTAGLMQIPYFLWLIIALYLNIGVALLN